LRGGAVDGISVHPQAALEGVGVIVEREEGAVGERGGVAADAVVVVELRGADAKRDVEGAGLRTVLRGEHSAGGGQQVRLLLSDGVGQEVGRRVGLRPEGGEVTFHFGGQDLHERRLGRGLGGETDGKESKGNNQEREPHP
jgi:hypothetical protein